MIFFKMKLKLNLLFPYIFLGICFFVFNLYIFYSGDDISHINAGIKNLSFIEFLQYAFNVISKWSSRTIVDTLCLIFLKLDFWIFKVVNIFMYLLGAYSLNKILNREKEILLTWFTVFLLLLYPIWHMFTAGWVGTTVTYLWTICLLLFSYTFIFAYLQNKKHTLLDIVFFTFSAIVAYNVEQAAVFSFIFNTGILVYLLYKRQRKSFIFYCFCLSMISLVNHLISGNKIMRFSAEIRWFPDYMSLNIIDKMQRAYSSTLAHFISTPNFIFLVFALLLFFVCKYKYSSSPYISVSLLPLIVVCFSGFFAFTHSSIYFSRLITLFNNNVFSNDFFDVFSTVDFVPLNVRTFANIINYLPYFISFITLGAIFISFYLIFGNSKKTLLIVSIFFLGICSRLIMGFTPTLYASGLRTFIITYFSIISCSLMLFKELLVVAPKKIATSFFTFTAVISVIFYFNNLAILISVK